MNCKTILDIIISNIKYVKPSLENYMFKTSDNLVNLGTNSVERSEIIMMTLEKLDLRIPLVETYGPNNIGELAQLLSDKKLMNENAC
ncbi:hypothetical protein AB835_05585 [Candidatus Endobugula sertula]|uniref:Acyl carrier protein n=1 Tax=Candidatus Endobugula sertula TaxID=62101 RepID=A0A1D2QR90_9GAMM|nr:hypothetical protein AB835_05585 [Candidatus Endobugula sertula]